MKSVAVVASSELTVQAFLREHLAALSREYKVCLIVPYVDATYPGELGLPLEVVSVRIVRPISLLADLSALVALVRLFRKRKFDLVYSVTPKAGLLAGLAGYACRVPVRIHTFTGQVWVTRTGLIRRILRAADKLIAGMATHALVDSKSQLKFLVDEGIVKAGKAAVLADGSISGVDLDRFRPDAAARISTRRQLHIPPDALVFVFVGRLNIDKGVLDLAQAFGQLPQDNWHLLFVGPDEEGLGGRLARAAGANASRLHFAGYTKRTEDFLSSGDVFCLPSYREGFGTSIIEAAAAGLPAIGSRIYGVVDAIAESHTGLLFPAGNVTELARCMFLIGSDQGLRIRLASSARERALRLFSSDRLTAALLEYLRNALAAHLPC